MKAGGMTEYAMHSFCTSCGGHRRRMPFGSSNKFWDTGPCPRCGGFGSESLVVRRGRVGRWPWQRGWVAKDGEPVEPLQALRGDESHA